MKRTTRRRLVLGREVVVALLTELQDARMQDARGGAVFVKSLMPAWICSGNCLTIDQ
jgi:hypothetical protein